MYTVNPELFKLAQQKLFEKSAVVPGQMAQDAMAVDPAAMGAVPPAGPMDPAAAMGGMPPQGGDPSAAMASMAPPDPAAMMQQPPAAPAPAVQQKLKPEQMMQMLDYRLYNMQQQLTAIMNAMGVEVAPESLVLPPGTTGAPPAEAALPGGPMAPPPPSAAPTPAGGPMPPGGPVPPGAPPMEEAPKMAHWWEDTSTPQKIGRPFAKQEDDGDSPTPMQTKAGAIAALCRSLLNNDS
jgi:hypothetical protein